MRTEDEAGPVLTVDDPPLYAVGQVVAFSSIGHPPRIGTIEEIVLLPGMRRPIYHVRVGEELGKPFESEIGAVQVRQAHLDGAPDSEEENMVAVQQDYSPANTGTNGGPPLRPEGAPPGMYVRLPLAWSEPDPDNPPERSTTGLEELRTSLRDRGQLEPIGVYKVGPTRFRVKYGHRRRAAALLEGWTHLNAIIVEPPADDAARVEDLLISNLAQDALTGIQEAQGYSRLIALGRKQTEIAAKVGKSQPHIANMLRLLHLPKAVQTAICQGKLTAGHGLELARLAGAADELNWQGPTGKTASEVQIRLAADAVTGSHSVRDLKGYVDSWQATQRSHHNRAAELVAAHARDAERTATRAADPERAAQDDAARETERERANAEWAAQAEARRLQSALQEDARLARMNTARAALAAALGWEEGQQPTLAVWKVLAWRLASQGTSGLTREQEQATMKQIAASDEESEIQAWIAELVVKGLPLSYDGWGLATSYNSALEYANQAYGLNTAIRAAQVEAGLIEAPAPAPQETGEEEEDDEEELPSCPECGLGQLIRDDDGVICCPDCETAFPDGLPEAAE